MKNLLMAALVVLGTGTMTFAQTGQPKAAPAKEVKSEKHAKKAEAKEAKAEVKAEAKKTTATVKATTPAKKEVKAVKTTVTK
ncbi:hypothetical protein HYN48_05095 [Flavobacterium magnum]|uniref:Acid-shock protein n=1 Tax=Flavobacterium magnum TaxID=2162713 RepID=A0A2S0RCZ8_9FLAO|nr:hypothetical protein [Flavobacterium magnum]AWA29514.1 hypothetical protein HYN48_05095 [Flavobacterium magnum]